MFKTTRGLPNTCSQCGSPVKKEDGWFAKNEDEARSGGGVCAKCNGRDVEQTKVYETPADDVEDTPADDVEDTPADDVPAEDHQPDVKKKSYGR